MRKKIFVSAFSINMFNMPEPLGIFDYDARITLEFEKLHEDDIRLWISQDQAEWHIGHEATAEVLSRRFDVPIKADRKALIWPKRETSDDLDEELIVVTLGRRLNEGQILTEAEVEQMPMTFWGIFCTRYNPSEPIKCFCGEQATHYNDDKGHYYCEEHKDDQTDIKQFEESDDQPCRCMDCGEQTTIMRAQRIEDSETHRTKGYLCHDCYVQMMALEIVD